MAIDTVPPSKVIIRQSKGYPNISSGSSSSSSSTIVPLMASMGSSSFSSMKDDISLQQMVIQDVIQVNEGSGIKLSCIAYGGKFIPKGLRETEGTKQLLRDETHHISSHLLQFLFVPISDDHHHLETCDHSSFIMIIMYH